MTNGNKTAGEPIRKTETGLEVPDQPIIPFIAGDGTGPDIWRAAQRVFDGAVEKAYGGKRRIVWRELWAGERSYKELNTWLPEETVEAFREYLVGIKGPLTTPVGGGIRSLNVALRQKLDAQLMNKLKARKDEFLPGEDYIEKWGYKVGKNGTMQYKK